MDAVIIAFASGKGGTGKSTVSVLTGGALAALNQKVLLVELDSGLRSVDMIAGVSGQTVYDVEDVLSGRVAPVKAVVPSPTYPGLSIISAPYSGGGVVQPQALKILCTQLRSHFDYILLDTAAGLGAPFWAAAATAHRMMLVLTPDPVALRDGRIIADELADKANHMRLILNRVDPPHILRDGILRDLDEAIDIVGVQLLGVVPESPAIAKAAFSGDPLPKNGAENAVFAAIAKRIMGKDIPLVVK